MSTQNAYGMGGCQHCGAAGHSAGESVTDETYNGWTNRETWAVALHINNDQGWQESIHASLRESIAQGNELHHADNFTITAWAAGDIIRENVEEMLDVDRRVSIHGAWYAASDLQWLAMRDIGSLWRVNWTELGAAFLSDLESSDSN